MSAAAMKQLLIGLPDSGKTTFLAALYHFVEAAEVPHSLKLSRLSGEQRYLNLIRDAWLECRRVARTNQGAEETVTMHLHAPDSGRITEVHIPDLSGEFFRSQWRDRKWTTAYASLCSEASGALLFLHPDKIERARCIHEADTILDEIEEPAASAPQQVDPAWRHEHAPTEVQLVDLLQFLVAQGRTAPLRLAIIISAWDVLRELDLSPPSWLAKEQPLLHQYLRANPESFVLEVYGVSAQGGDIDNTEQRQALHDKFQPSERIQVVGASASPHDIAAPIKWLMG